MTAHFSLAHPSRKRLRDWLYQDSPSRLTQHVERCERCATLLEELADEPETVDASIPAEFGAAIREVFAPPPDLSERVIRKISERERAQQELSLLFGMISISKDVAELMMPHEDAAESGEREQSIDDNKLGETEQ